MYGRGHLDRKDTLSLPPILCFSISIFFMTMSIAHAQIERIEPPNWWTGFRDSTLQLMVRGKGIGDYTAHARDEWIKVVKNHRADSPNYLFFDLEIPENTAEGEIRLVFRKEGEPEMIVPYLFKKRERAPEDFVGFSSEDAIYLITPDRFANGDPSNDIIPSLKEKKVDRKQDYARHGGDIRGMILPVPVL